MLADVNNAFSGVPNRECTEFARSWYHWSYFVCCSTCTLTIKQFKEKSAVDFKNNVGWGLKWSTCQMFGLIFFYYREFGHRGRITPPIAAIYGWFDVSSHSFLRWYSFYGNLTSLMSSFQWLYLVVLAYFILEWTLLVLKSSYWKKKKVATTANNMVIKDRSHGL